METKVYSTFVFDSEPLWDEVPEGKLEFSHWDSLVHYNTFFKMCFVRDKGIYLRMRSDEKELREVCNETDEPVYEDSCMEFFLCALEGREEYINLEMNPKGAYLSEYGKGKTDRVFLKIKTKKTPLIITQRNEEGWSLEAFLSCELISEVYGADFRAQECVIKGNFYKCGDKTERVHYGAYNEMTSLPPGFHNPERFAVIEIRTF